jgi:hypothetical protein
MRDYLKNNYKEREIVIDKLFTSYNNFASKLASVFSKVDKKRSIEQEL